MDQRSPNILSISGLCWDIYHNLNAWIRAFVHDIYFTFSNLTETIAPPNLRFIEKSRKTVSIEWDSVVIPDAEIVTIYTVEYTDDKWATIQTEEVAGNLQNATFGGLSPTKTYKFRVTAIIGWPFTLGTPSDYSQTITSKYNYAFAPSWQNESC